MFVVLERKKFRKGQAKFASLELSQYLRDEVRSTPELAPGPPDEGRNIRYIAIYYQHVTRLGLRGLQANGNLASFFLVACLIYFSCRYK